MADYSHSSSQDLPKDELILWEELGPVDRRVRRVLYDAGILSSLNIVVDHWVDHWRDERGHIGFRIGVQAAPVAGTPAPPCDAMLTVACEAHGPREEQERRLLVLLFSIRVELVDSGSFQFVLAASDSLYAREEGETPRFRRCHLGFNVTDSKLLEEQREWEESRGEH